MFQRFPTLALQNEFQNLAQGYPDFKNVFASKILLKKKSGTLIYLA